MNALNENATAAFHWLVKGLPVHQYRTYPTPNDALEPVTVERLSEHRYLIGFYFEQNGDLCADPEILLEVQADQVVPLRFKSWTGVRSTDLEELVPYVNELLPLMRSRVESATKRGQDDLNDTDVQRLAIHLEHHLVHFVPGGSQ
jgi:hypothetical protein